jgi:hypothetical protein
MSNITWRLPEGLHKEIAPKDNINPYHYRAHPSGIECIQVTEHMGFNIGNAIKYLWRCDLKEEGKKDIEDLKKAIWYLNRELELRCKVNLTHQSPEQLPLLPD